MTAEIAPPFDFESAPSRRRRPIMFVAAAVAVVALVGGVVLSRAASSSTARYRTAEVADRDVESVITGVGSIEPVSQATMAFPISGTVDSVSVAVGDSVATGQTLATIDVASLTVALHEKQATLAKAQLMLTKALSSTSTSSAASSSAAAAAPSTSSTTTSSGPSTAAGGSGDGSAAVAAAQQAVVAGQHAVDAALAVADQALASSAQICAAATATPTSTSIASGDASSADTVTACQTALQAVQTAQAAVATAQATLASASSTLDSLLAQQASSLASASTGSTSAGSPAGSSSSSGSSPTASSATGATGTATGSTASSSDLIADQKAVDAAEAEVAVAEQNLAQTTLISPISGTVASVDLAVGDAVTAASSTAHIVVVGAGGFEVTTTVSIDHIPDVKVGQRATVLPDGQADPVVGQVVAISLTPATSTTGTTYRVTIGLDGQGAGLGNGSTGSVTITTAGVSSALSVPTSAVRTSGTTHTVTLVDGSSTTTQTVQVGVIGSQWTQITDGLTAGQVVSLANLDEALPGSATSSSNGGTSSNARTGTFTPPSGAAPPEFTGGR